MVKAVRCMCGSECCIDHRLLRAKLSLMIKKKMSNCGPKVPKRIEVSQMVCVEKLERFQFAVHATDLVASPDPANNFAKNLYEVAANSFEFVSSKHQDCFADSQDQIIGLLVETKIVDRLMICPEHNIEKKLETTFKKCKARVQPKIRITKNA